MGYDFGKIEKKWQKVWAKNKYKIWAAEAKKPHKAYVLDMFPYPSGEGLHVGHVEGYTASDIYARYLRMNGFNVLHPMGWDAFGLPAENYAIKTKTHPSLVVKKNVKNFTSQLRSLGFSYDWQREINTTDPEYYKWTQWIFLQLFKKGLAYEAEVPVNWCPTDKTVLSNEEITDGACERCGSQVERRNLKQWLLKITAYADRLLQDLEGLDWPERVKEMQRNWIGKDRGLTINFKTTDGEVLPIWTKFWETVFGTTFIVVAPEIVATWRGMGKKFSAEVNNYVDEAIKKAADELSTVAQAVGAKMYEAQGKAGEAGDAGEAEKKTDEPIDAEFTEKKE